MNVGGGVLDAPQAEHSYKNRRTQNASAFFAGFLIFCKISPLNPVYIVRTAKKEEPSMKDRELTRLLQTRPEEGLEAAMLDYAPLVKAVLNRILPQNPCDREECMADVFVSL